MFAEREGGGHADCEVVAADVEDGGCFDEFPDVRLLQVRDLVVVGGGEVRAHCAVVVGDDDAAFAGGGGGVDVVFYVEAWRG